MKGGGRFSRMFGRSKEADPFAAMGRNTGTFVSSPVGVPVAPAPVAPGPNGQSAHAVPPAEAPAERPVARTPSGDAGRVADAWGGVCDHFALQVLLLAEELRPALDQLEIDEQDAERLDRLYQVDHAVTRMRRCARDLRVLASRGDDVEGPTTSLIDTVRVAQSSIERFTQVSIGAIIDLAVVGYVSDDIASLLAALLDNATRYSPSTVTVSAHLLAEGAVMFRIEDSGIGLTGPHVAALNTVLDAEVPAIDDHTSRHTGFAVVHRLARKHGIRVQLAGKGAPGGGSGGTTAMVTIPPGLLTEIPDPPLAMAPPTSGAPEPDPTATAHLTVARPARRGPVAAVPDDPPDAPDTATEATGPQPPTAATAGDATARGAGDDDATAPTATASATRGAPAATSRFTPGDHSAKPPAAEAPASPVRADGLPPLPRREPTSLRGSAPGAPGARGAAPEPDATDAAEERRSFAEDIAAFTAAFEPPTGPSPDPSADPVAEPFADPSPEPPAGPVAESSAGPVAELPAEPPAAEPSEPVSDLHTDPVAGPPAPEPVADPSVTDPVGEPPAPEPFAELPWEPRGSESPEPDAVTGAGPRAASSAFGDDGEPALWPEVDAVEAGMPPRDEAAELENVDHADDIGPSGQPEPPPEPPNADHPHDSEEQVP